jgi:hypothetical protein
MYCGLVFDTSESSITLLRESITFLASVTCPFLRGKVSKAWSKRFRTAAASYGLPSGVSMRYYVLDLGLQNPHADEVSLWEACAVEETD